METIIIQKEIYRGGLYPKPSTHMPLKRQVAFRSLRMEMFSCGGLARSSVGRVPFADSSDSYSQMDPHSSPCITHYSRLHSLFHSRTLNPKL